MEFLPIILAFMVGAIASAIVAIILSRSTARAASASLSYTESLLDSANDTIEVYKNALEAQEQRLATQKEDFARLQQMARLEFEKVASDILENKSQKFTQLNEEKMGMLLRPLNTSISQFKERIEQTFTEQTKQRTSLEAQVRELVETTAKVGAEANNLASALKGDVKKMGNWGEMVLESILENSGLVRDRQYIVQGTMEDAETGRKLRPDVVVKLPEERVVIIDSKVSLVAYDRYCSAENEVEQKAALREHITSIKNHVDGLASKNYDNMTSSLDFVLMFVPIEPAYLIAIKEDSELWNYAYSKRILLISPTNLIACLKLISDLWKREMQSKNAMEIVQRAELMYEKFVGFVGSMEKVGDSLSKTQTAYDTAFSQLSKGRGNLITQAETMRSLGLKSAKRVKESLLEAE